MLASLLISIAAFFAWLNFIQPFVWPYTTQQWVKKWKISPYVGERGKMRKEDLF